MEMRQLIKITLSEQFLKFLLFFSKSFLITGRVYISNDFPC